MALVRLTRSPVRADAGIARPVREGVFFVEALDGDAVAEFLVRLPGASVVAESSLGAALRRRVGSFDLFQRDVAGEAFCPRFRFGRLVSRLRLPDAGLLCCARSLRTRDARSLRTGSARNPRTGGARSLRTAGAPSLPAGTGPCLRAHPTPTLAFALARFR